MGKATNTSLFYPALRLAWIERAAHAHGEISRPEIMAAFGIGAPQVSADITALLAMHPGCLVYDLSAKRYYWRGKKLVTSIPSPVVSLDLRQHLPVRPVPTRPARVSRPKPPTP